MKLRDGAKRTGTAFVVAVMVMVVSHAFARATYDPVATAAVSDLTAGTTADIVLEFNVPAGHHAYSTLITFTPPEFFVASDADIEDGAYVADLTRAYTLGLMNSPCSNDIDVSYTLLDATTDSSETVTFEESYADSDRDGLADGVERYPDFLNTVFPGLTPKARLFGSSIDVGANATFNVLIFEPGTSLPGLPAFEPSLGYPLVTVFNDHTGDLVSWSPITDVCSPLTVTAVTFGLTRDNPDTAADESGQIYRSNPSAGGDYMFTVFSRSLHDADSDGIDNSLDTCPFDINDGDPRVAGGGDDDLDGIDNACDPRSMEPHADYDGDGYFNRRDRCPLVGDPAVDDIQADADGDFVGDACDPNPDTPDGISEERALGAAVTIEGPRVAPPSGGGGVVASGAWGSPTWPLFFLGIAMALLFASVGIVASVARQR